MDFVVRTHEVLYSLQDLGTFRNGDFVRDMLRMKKGKVGSSLRKRNTSSSSSSSSSSLSSGSLQVTAVSSSLETPGYTSRKLIRADGRMASNQVTDSFSADSNSRLWRLIKREKKLDEAFEFLKSMIASEYQIPDVIACSRLIQKLFDAGRTRKAAQVLELVERSQATVDVRTYNVFIKGLCNAGEIDNALKLLRRLHSDEGRCDPDVYLYNIVLKAMFKRRRFEQGMKLFDEMMSKGIEPDAFICNTVVTGMCKNGSVDEALKLVTSRSSSYSYTPSVESYNMVLNCLCNAERFSDAAKLLADMADREGYSPDAFTLMILIRILCSEGLWHQAIALVESMPEYGCTPGVCHYFPVINCLCKEQNIEMAIECGEVMISRGCYPNIVIFNTLLAALCKQGNVDAAVEFFNELLASRSCPANLATYNIMIEVLSRVGRADQALELLDEVRGSKDFKLNPYTYAALIVGLIDERKMHKAIRILDELKGSRVVVPCRCYNWMIKPLCKAGETDHAIDLVVYMFSKGCHPINSSYAALVEGLARVGLVTEGLELLNELSVRGAMDKTWAKRVAIRIEKICSRVD